MPKGKGGVNQKAAAALEKKAEVANKKAAKAAAAEETELQKEWSKGANNRGTARAEEQALKADEAARKRREKAELLAQEEAELGPGGKAKNNVHTAANKKKGGKKKNDLALLEDALVSSADKKLKAKKAADQAKAEKLKREQIEREQAKAEAYVDPLLANTDSMIGTMDMAGRAANKAKMKEELEGGAAASGLDSAFLAMGLGNNGEVVTSRKALHKAFEEKMMPIVKEEHPGLKHSQYKEKIFHLWKKSPENPDNQAD